MLDALASELGDLDALASELGQGFRGAPPD